MINGNLPGASFHRVVIDEVAGADMATQHLIDLGHREIAIMCGNKQMSKTIQRVQGYERAMKRNGLLPDRKRILYGWFSVGSGKELLTELLASSGGSKVTAVFCANDLIAIGAIKAAIKAELRVPNDLSIIGFDDIPFAANSIPELTTISLKSNELGRTAANVLHKLITDKKVSKLTLLQPELVTRESTAPLNLSG